MLSLPEYVSPSGLLSMSQFVNKLSFWKCTHSQFQIEGKWDDVAAELAGGKSSPLCPSFPLLSLTSFLDLPEYIG
jgi:hypothetical protein